MFSSRFPCPGDMSLACHSIHLTFLHEIPQKTYNFQYWFKRYPFFIAGKSVHLSKNPIIKSQGLICSVEYYDNDNDGHFLQQSLVYCCLVEKPLINYQLFLINISVRNEDQSKSKKYKHRQSLVISLQFWIGYIYHEQTLGTRAKN